MRALIERILGGEDWLIDRILRYAKERGYARYTSTLREAWRQSIAGLSRTLIQVAEGGGGALELGPDDDPAADPASAFGVLEARRHRERGVTLPMFLGLMKYYRLSYLDLVTETDLPAEVRSDVLRLIHRFFDRVEVAFCGDWAGGSAEARLCELQTQNRLMTNEKNKYLTIFESIPTPVIWVEPDLRIGTMNHAAVSLFQGQTIPGAVHYSEDPARWELSAELAQELSAFVDGAAREVLLERDLFTAKGRRCFAILLHRMLDVSDKFRGAVVILTDVTDRKRADEERRLMAERLLYTQKLESLGVLAGGVAHDFNNILAGILGAADLSLREVPAGSRPQQRLLEIRQLGERAADVTRQMLAYAGRGSRLVGPLPLNGIIREMSQLLLANISKKAEIRFDLQTDLPSIPGDVAQIRQLVTNLILNAAEALEDKAGTIVVTTRVVAACPSDRASPFLEEAPPVGECVLLQVTDSGCGLAPEIRERIFDPFFSTKVVGRGLGLSAVLGIVRSHRGSIGVESAPGKGSTFSVWFSLGR